MIFYSKHIRNVFFFFSFSAGNMNALMRSKSPHPIKAFHHSLSFTEQMLRRMISASCDFWTVLAEGPVVVAFVLACLLAQ